MRLLAILLLLLSNMVYSQNDYIPIKAFQYKDILQKELDNNFKELYDYNYVAALIEQESCISLHHPKCWSSTSQLKTSRETG